MELQVENFRHIKRAHVELADKLTLIAGRNRAGKSSLIQSLQAAVIGNALPISELKKKDASALVHSSQKSGHVFLKWKDGTSKVSWPSCKVALENRMLNCSPYAAGTLIPTAIPAKDLTQVLNILPTFEDFKTEMEMPSDLEPLPTQQIWDVIQRAGWDEAHNQAILKGRDLKRDWERLSGENWGPQKAAEWKPEHFTGQPLDVLETGLRTAEKLYEYAVKTEALSEKEREDLQNLANEREGAQKLITDLTAQLSAANTELSKAQELLQTLPKILNEQKAYECWKCGAIGLLQGNKMVQPPDKTGEEDVAATRQRVAEQNQVLRDLQEKREKINFKLHEARTYFAKCEDAQRKTQQIVLDEPKPALSVEDARAEIELCRKRIAAYKTKLECEEIAQLLGINAYVCGILHPEGLRKQVLVKRLESFNELLANICKTAEWPHIILDEYLYIRLDGQPYALLSVSEKFLANTALQIAIAQVDGSEIIIVDGIDILVDRSLRNGLMSILLGLSIRVIIGCAFNSEAEVPDLGDFGGVAYWCENGTTRVMHQKVAA